MRKHWIRFVSFWMVFAILFSLLNLAMISENARWSYFYHLPENSIDVIFIGNSHSFMSFQPQIIDSIIPINSFTLGIDAENIIISYFELREALKSQHPRVVVLETSSLDILDLRKKGYIFEFLDAGTWNLNKFAIGARYVSPEAYYSLFPALRTRVDWNNPTIYLNAFLEQTYFFISDKNIPQQSSFFFSSNSDHNWRAPVRTHAIIDNIGFGDQSNVNKEFKEPSPDIDIYLNKVYQLCLENDIQLVLATAPVLEERMVESEFYAPYDESAFVRANNIPVITFSEDQFSLLHFYNATHVNMLGSTIVSVETAKSLAQIMDLQIDEDALSFYESFVFTDYAMVKENGHYSFDLIPANEDTPLEYQWKLFNATNGETTVLSEWSTNSSAEFDIDENGGLIYLVYEIRNPAGEETIGVSFPLKKGE